MGTFIDQSSRLQALTRFQAGFNEPGFGAQCTPMQITLVFDPKYPKLLDVHEHGTWNKRGH